MDYMDILKRAWKITWRYRILWLFGLFAGGSGGGGGGGGGGNAGGNFSEPTPGLERSFEDFGQWFADNLVLVAAVAGLLVVIGIVWWILSIAAGPGLVHLVTEAEAGRPVRGRDGWRVGFRYWWRHLGLLLVLYLPFLAALMLLAGLGIVAVLPVADSGGGGDALGGMILGLCCFGGVFIIVLILAAVVLGLLYTLGLRFIVLRERGVFDAIREAWALVRSSFKNVAVMWLLVVAVGIAYGIVVGLVAVMLALPAVFMFMAGNLTGAIAVFVVLVLMMLLPTAIFGTFGSAIWTVFFNQVVGGGPAAGTVAPEPYAPEGYQAPPPTPDTYLPQPPPAAPPAPTAPPTPEPPSPRPAPPEVPPEGPQEVPPPPYVPPTPPEPSAED